MRIEFEMITSMCVQSSVLIGEVFQIEVSDGHVTCIQLACSRGHKF